MMTQIFPLKIFKKFPGHRESGTKGSDRPQESRTKGSDRPQDDLHVNGGVSSPPVLAADGEAVLRALQEADVDPHQRTPVQRHHLTAYHRGPPAGQRRHS